MREVTEKDVIWFCYTLCGSALAITVACLMVLLVSETYREVTRQCECGEP